MVSTTSFLNSGVYRLFGIPFSIIKHPSKDRPPKQLPKEVEEDLLTEAQRLRAENDYLKNLQALVLEDERRQHKKRW